MLVLRFRHWNAQASKSGSTTWPDFFSSYLAITYIHKFASEVALSLSQEGEGFSFRACTARSPDPMHVVFDGLREVEVYDVLYVLDVFSLQDTTESPRRHVRSHQNVLH
jgi:hypothetical protein